MVDGGMSQRRALRPLEELAADEDHQRHLETRATPSAQANAGLSTARLPLRGMAKLHKGHRRDWRRPNGKRAQRASAGLMAAAWLDENGDAEVFDARLSLPSDTELAIWTLRAQFPRAHLGEDFRYTAPVVLRSQLCALLDDHLDTYNQLHGLRVKGVIREVTLLGTALDRVVVLTQDIVQLCLEHARDRAADDGFDAARREQRLRLLFTHVYPRCTDLFVSRDALQSALRSSASVGPIDDIIEELIRAGLLVQRDPASFWFALPHMAQVATWIRKGRQQLIRKLERARFGQLLLSKVARERLNKSRFEPLFHVRDVVGRGEAAVLATAQGPLLRLERDANS